MGFFHTITEIQELNTSKIEFMNRIDHLLKSEKRQGKS